MNKIFKFEVERNDGTNKPVVHEFTVYDQPSEVAAKKWLTEKQEEMGVSVKFLKSEELEPPKPDNTVEEVEDGFYFPAWGLHVASLQLEHKRGGRFRKDKPISRHIDLAEAKQLVKEHHGIDVDNDIPPPSEHVEARRSKTKTTKES